MARRKTRYSAGSTMLMALVFLLLFSFMGAASMRSSTFQEKMTSNAMQTNYAFQRAEAALRAGEMFVESNNATIPATQTTMALPTAGSLPTINGAGAWTAVETNRSYYFINRLNYTTGVFAVTAIGYGNDANTRTVLQSTYRPN